MPRRRYSLNLDPELHARVKAQLGDTSFSRFTERALEAALGGSTTSQNSVTLRGGVFAAEEPPSSDDDLRQSIAAAASAPKLLESTEKPSPAELRKSIRDLEGVQLRCPVSGCDFGAASPKARCAVHGRTVVEA